MHFSQSCKAFRHNDHHINLARKRRPMNVSDVMRRSFATIRPDASLLDAAHLLLETNQRGLPVIDSEGTLVGVISEGDFLHRVELDIARQPETGWKKSSALKRTPRPADGCGRALFGKQ